MAYQRISLLELLPRWYPSSVVAYMSGQGSGDGDDAYRV